MSSLNPSEMSRCSFSKRCGTYVLAMMDSLGRVNERCYEPLQTFSCLEEVSEKMKW